MDSQMNKPKSSGNRLTKTPAFVARGERAMRRAANDVKVVNRAHKLPVIVWKDGKVAEKAP